VEKLTSGAHRQVTSISSDGKTLIFRQRGETTGHDIGILRLDRGGELETLIQTPFDEHSAMLSPDHRWLAYVSNESGRNEIYVRPYPGLEGQYKISIDGGNEPMWAPSGKELFYREDDKMMKVNIKPEPEFAAGTPEFLFEGRYLAQSPHTPMALYDISPDGRYFLMIQEADEEAAPLQIHVVLNWEEELKRLVPIE
jgi:serine/threonine-protein kinase